MKKVLSRGHNVLQYSAGKNIKGGLKLSSNESAFAPSKQYADIIIPHGGKNRIAIDMIRVKLNNLMDIT